MNTKNKILILPLLIFLFAGSTLFIEKPFKEDKTTFSKSIPFPYKQESKTEWTKPTWQNNISKTSSAFICILTKNDVERPIRSTTFFNFYKIFYNSEYYCNHAGRSPPNFS
ncbi:MAG TPA: hypothetical protein VF270_07075 [Ignavibacteriaceae bacterium]